MREPSTGKSLPADLFLKRAENPQAANEPEAPAEVDVGELDPQGSSLLTTHRSACWA